MLRLLIVISCFLSIGSLVANGTATTESSPISNTTQVNPDSSPDSSFHHAANYSTSNGLDQKTAGKPKLAARRSDGWLRALAGIVGTIEQLSRAESLEASSKSSEFNATKTKTTTNSTGDSSNPQNNGQQSAFKGKQQKLNASAIAAEKDNLLSVTRQLVKLARNQFGGGNLWFGSGSQGRDAGLFGGNSMGLLSAASQLAASSFYPEVYPDASAQVHNFGHGHAMSAKSDWFWLVMPAVIVFGAGVIVVPLIAAWLVSNAMGQSTLTVSAGKRRRRRDVSGFERPGELTLESNYADLFKMLNLHQLLDEAPDLLVNKLAKLNGAFESFKMHFLDTKATPSKYLKQKQTS